MTKILLINGSPRRNGNTHIALKEIADTLQKEGHDTEIAWIGNKAIRGCIACGTCKMKGNGHCVFNDDVCNEMIDKINEADGFIIGAPVYYGVPAGQVLSLIQRAFFAGAQIANKPAAAVAICRRGGATSAFQTLQMPLQMTNTIVVTSQYWNIVYGREQGEAALDIEGLQTMRQLGRNMSWILKKIEGAPCDLPEHEEWQGMHFIR